MTRIDLRRTPALGVGLRTRSGGYCKAMSNITLIIVIVVAVAIIVALVVAGAQMARRKRTEQLRQQYGPEYDRAIDESDSQRAAESELRDRSKRHDELELRDHRPRGAHRAVVPLGLIAGVSEPALLEAESARVSDPPVHDQNLSVGALPSKMSRSESVETINSSPLGT